MAQYATVRRKKSAPNQSISLHDHCWFWGSTSREEVNICFRKQPEGTFVVRESSSAGNYTLTIRKGGNNRLIRIYHKHGKYGFTEPYTFQDIPEIIEYCRRNSLVKYNRDLDIILKYPLCKMSKVAGPHISQYESLFSQADPAGKGVIGAAEAAVFLKKSSLKELVLSQIWELSDPAGRGFLDKQGFFVALKLIALAQNSKEVSMANITVPVPPPVMGSVSPAMAPLGSMGTTWAIQVQEKTKYDEIFDGLGPMNGLLSGDKVRPVLMNSKLPVDILGRVWDLSDIDKDGFLDREEFAVAMHLVYKALEKEPVPMTLPPDLIPPGKRVKKAMSTVGVPVLPDIMGSIKSASSIPEPEVRSPPAFATDFNMSATSAPPAGPAWVVTAMEKTRYDDMFKVADTDMDGYVNGQEIKDIFLNSGVASNVLAHIWNLCDTQGIGKLNADQFALAMYLIQEKLKGTEPPPQLTPEMMPPSLRPAAGNVGEASGMVTDFDTSGMKELDEISREIEEIKREKILLEQDKAQKEADIRIRNGELQALQKELDTTLLTVKQLETQKGEAQKRLDELDDKKNKVESIAQELQEKCSDEQRKVDNLRSQIMSSEISAKNREEELRRMRDELNSLRQEEVELQQKVETGKTQLDALSSSLSETEAEINKTKHRVTRLQDVQNKINQCINQYNSLLSGESGTEPDLSFLSEREDTSTPDVPKTTFTKPVMGTMSTDPFKSSDPFKDDPFKNTAPSDPFKGADPFASTVKSESKQNTSSFDDPFGFPSAPAAKSDPFGGKDPFGSAFETPKSKATNDPFGAFGGVGGNDLKSPINPDDPFGTGNFSGPKSSSKNSLNIHFPPKRDKSPALNLPSKQKKAPPPPRPPAIKRTPSPAPPKKESAPGGDLFGGQDPFAPSTNTRAPSSQSNDLFANFDDFGSSTANKPMSEADQLVWATKSSQEDWERQRRLQEQEQADLELAIQLSKQS